MTFFYTFSVIYLLKLYKEMNTNNTMTNCDKTRWGKIYVITNKDFPEEVYVGSTEQQYLCKRKYRHRKEWEWGNQSYGNLFTTENYDASIVEMESGLVGEELRMRERQYYDVYIEQGLKVCNQNVPWSTPEEKKEKMKKLQREWYIQQKLKKGK